MHRENGGCDSRRSWCSLALSRADVAWRYSSCGDEHGTLRGIVGLHVDDILAAGDEYFEAKLEEVNKAVGFGSVKKNKFVHCGKEYPTEGRYMSA